MVILSVLVAVHEGGHFAAAKWAGARVKEYAIGFPPRIFSRRKGHTLYSLGAVPFGGFVAIAGEEGEDEEGEEKIPIEEKLSAKHPFKKILVLAAGVTANVVFAWFLLSITLAMGTYEPVAAGAPVPENAEVLLVSITPQSPASEAGLSAGDRVLKLTSLNDTVIPKTAEDMVDFLSRHQNDKISLNVLSAGVEKNISGISAVEGIAEGKKALGVGVSTAVKRSYSLPVAFVKGVSVTGQTLEMITVGTGHALWEIIHGRGGFQDISGPVGIGKIVGEARTLGLVSVITFAAFISLNLAIINILPFPALDGGRILFTIFEWITGKPVSTKISRAVHGAGFAFLIFLMLIVTVHDISRLFS